MDKDVRIKRMTYYRAAYAMFRLQIKTNEPSGGGCRIAQSQLFRSDTIYAYIRKTTCIYDEKLRSRDDQKIIYNSVSLMFFFFFPKSRKIF